MWKSYIPFNGITVKLVHADVNISTLFNWFCVFLFSHSSSEHSDWTADAGITAQAAMSSRRRARRQISSSEEEEEEDNTAEDEQTEQTQDEDVQSSSPQKPRKAKSKAPKASIIGGV